MNLDKSFSKRKHAFPKYLDNEYNLTEWPIRSYEVDFKQTLNDCNILQIIELLKIQRTAVTE